MAKSRASRSSAKHDLVGRQLGDYRLVSLMATGGMARIYRGVDVKLGRQAAVKVVSQEMLETDETLFERFQREAKAVAPLEHPNIITIFQYGEQDDVYFLVMKLVEGEDLAEVLNRLQRQGKLMPVRRMFFILEQVASALDYAHARGIIHRDVKPSNILLDKEDRATLTDFGLVLRAEIDKTLGTAFGTPRYIAPEQALASEKAVPQSDIYALAVIVYEALTGHMVFKADTAMQIALSHISEPPPAPRSVNPTIPRPVERELLKALEKKPNKRHRTALEFLKALREAYGDDLPVDDSTEEIAPEIARSATPVFEEKPDISGKLRGRKARVEKDNKTQIVDQEPRTILKGETEAKRNRGRLRRLLTVTLIASLVIAGAIFVRSADDARSSSGATATTAASPTARPASVISTTGPDRTATPTATPTDDPRPVIAGSEPASLLYDFNVFALRNDGETALDVRRLAFVRNDGTNRFGAADRLPRDSVAPGDCLIIRVQTTVVEVPADWDCGSGSGETILNAVSPEIFWRAGPTEAFEVLLDGDTLMTCPTISPRSTTEGLCELTWTAVTE